MDKRTLKQRHAAILKGRVSDRLEAASAVVSAMLRPLPDDWYGDDIDETIREERARLEGILEALETATVLLSK
jgi:hypothetical protein